MKNVLVIAYYFPPSGGPGVQRVLKHIKYLKSFGWNPIILTVSNGQFPARDESLLNQVPKDIKVVRTHIYEPYDIYRKFTGKSKDAAIDVNTIKKDGQKIGLKEQIAEFIRATFFIPDARIGWLWSAKKAGLELIKEHNIKAIYSSSPPYTCSLIARGLQKKTGLPWVAGFRDPWTDFISTPKRWFLPKVIDKFLEKSVFKSADFVECAWQGIIKDALDKYPSLEQSKFIHVPNGFDSNDYPNVEYKSNKKFTLTYTGSMYGRRNPAALFEAVERLIKDNKVDKNDVRFVLVGRFGDEIFEMIKNASFSDNIESIAYLPHAKSVEYLMLSDALLLIVDESKESEEIVPGKVYEYIGSGRPVFAIAPEKSAIADLIEETKTGLLAHQSNVAKIADNYLQFYSAWKKNAAIVNPKNELIAKYERKNAAKKLAELLDNIN